MSIVGVITLMTHSSYIERRLLTLVLMLRC